MKEKKKGLVTFFDQFQQASKTDIQDHSQAEGNALNQKRLPPPFPRKGKFSSGNGRRGEEFILRQGILLDLPVLCSHYSGYGPTNPRCYK